MDDTPQPVEAEATLPDQQPEQDAPANAEIADLVGRLRSLRRRMSDGEWIFFKTAGQKRAFTLAPCAIEAIRNPVSGYSAVW